MTDGATEPDWRAVMPAGFRWPDGFRAAACFTFDVDAESPILFEHPESAEWLDVMSHQAYGARTGIARLLRVLDRRGVRATFFIPGYSAERWPAICRSIASAGHEIAHHGYLHEGAHGASPADEEARLLRGLAALDEVLGVRPIGYRAPNWELTFETPALLARHGFVYDSGLMDADHPYVLATSEAPGAPTIVELPGHWSLDDWEPYNYLPGITGSGVIASPADVLARWTLELDALVEEGGLFMLTNHPFVSGRASRAAALEQLIVHAQEMGDVWIATAAEIAQHVAGLNLSPVVHRRTVLPR
jgi:peptidoglycan/xylan/chitin deacetylase (PgdA/CDA1 family)